MRLFLGLFFYFFLISCASSGQMVGASATKKDQAQTEVAEQKNGFAAQSLSDTGNSKATEHQPTFSEEVSKDFTDPKRATPKKYSISKYSENVSDKTTLPQWIEIFVLTENSVGGYELEISYDPEVATFEKIIGGQSAYFKAIPWCDTQEVKRGKLILSAFHGDKNGPTGEVSLGRLLFQSKKTFSLKGQFRTLVSPDQQRISGEFVEKIVTKENQEQESTRPDQNSEASTEIFILTTFPLGGYALVLEYDSSLLHIQEIRGGSSPYFASPPFSSPNTYQSGTTKISGFYGGFPGPIGKISICWILFKTIQQGRTSLHIKNLELSDSEGELKEGASILDPKEIEIK